MSTYSHPEDCLASLASYLAKYQAIAEELWGVVKHDLKNEKVLRRYCACLRLCHRIKRQIGRIMNIAPNSSENASN